MRTETAGMAHDGLEVLRRGLAVAGGVLLVALGAQVALPIPGTPIPVTFQVPAVLLVGAALGPRLGAASLVAYLTVGVLGAPVFAPGGIPGWPRLMGPTGGYLLAFPAAAALTGGVVGNTRVWTRLLGGLVLGLVVIHLGGIAQLAILGGDFRAAVHLGSLPFLAGDGIKLLAVALILHRLPHLTNALR